VSDRATTPVRSVLRGVWRNPELRRLQLAYGNFNVAEMATWLATLVFAYDRGGATEAGVVATALLVPGAVFAPVVASIGERHPPGRFLTAGFVAQAATSAAVAAAMLGAAPLPLVYALLAVDSVAYTTTRPGQAALAPALARRPEELAATNVVSGWIESVSALVGPLLVGVILTVSSPGALFAVGAVVAVGAVALVRPLHAAPTAPPVDGDAEDASAPLRESIDFVRRDGNARILLFVLGA
jgi:MFS family permease